MEKLWLKAPYGALMLGRRRIRVTLLRGSVHSRDLQNALLLNKSTAILEQGWEEGWQSTGSQHQSLELGSHSMFSGNTEL